jgi:hypothetical protein
MPNLGGVAVFNPLSVSPDAWYDPSDLTTLFQNSNGTTAVAADGDPVGYMADKSGNGKHLVQAVAGSRPLYKTSGGLSWLLFDGTNDFISGALILAQPYDRLTAMRVDTFVDNRYLLDGESDQAVLRQRTTTPDLSQYAGAVGASNSAMSLAAAHVVTEHFEGASSILKIDSTSVATSVGTTNATAFTIGASPSGGNPTPMRFYGGFLKAGTLSAGNLASLQAYLRTKAGL